MQILFNLYSVKYSKITRYLMFKLIRVVAEDLISQLVVNQNKNGFKNTYKMLFKLQSGNNKLTHLPAL